MSTQTRTPTPARAHPPAPVRRARLLTLPGVYAPQYDTEFLMRALRREDIGEGDAVLDLGTGSGALAVAAARTGARVTAVDISWRAVLTARLNAFLSRQQVTVRHGTLSATEPAPERAYDLVVSNPPYVPSPPLTPRRAAARAWEGGARGRTVVDQVCDTASRVLRPGGVLLMVHSGLSGAQASIDRLQGQGMRAEVADRTYVPFGPVLRSRRAWLREQGLLADNATWEELVIIRAERS
ncbi:HemK2/MTQ2 family protein methyltransferase [Streptomyces monticola]|uniref:HemK2/MTQ2 family protein methyltransferase n=1 Tax=Streptomyces monticola TaxID=2666263 RepID=A0ABW2JDG5_9ACTN